LANIAAALTDALAQRKDTGSPGATVARVIASGDGWTVADVICTSGPDDRPFEEHHARYAIAVVAAGTFRYRSPNGREVMTPGSLMLGNEGHCFECGHEHGEGDRCVSFWYEPHYFERLVADAGARSGRTRFTVSRLPPLRDLSPLITQACWGALQARPVAWDELAITLAARSIELDAGVHCAGAPAPPNAEARVVRAVREIDRRPGNEHPLDKLAQHAGLSPYHFLRTFERTAGVTPHQYVMRTRLRHAAMRLLAEPGKVLDLALDCGFGDVSNFNRAFRAEFGMSPRAFREQSRTRGRSEVELSPYLQEARLHHRHRCQPGSIRDERLVVAEDRCHVQEIENVDAKVHPGPAEPDNLRHP
jgi:AraC-like DNA-binding protein